MRAAHLVCLSVAILAAPTCFAQLGAPSVSSVVNSASYYDHLAQGSIFTVFGYSLGPADLLSADVFPLPSELGGTSIKVTSGSSSLSCPMVYTSYAQLAAILPSNTPLGDATLTVTYKGATGTSSPAHIIVVASSVGLYSVASSGLGPGIITSSDFALKPLDRPARPGEVLIAWGTGLGAIDGNDAMPPPSGKQFANVEVFVGNSPATVVAAGRSGCCAGLDQIAFEVPNATFGCLVPVTVRTGGATVSNFVSVPISARGEACSNTAPGFPASLLNRAIAGDPLKLGLIAIGPVRLLEFLGFSFSQGAQDQLSALLHGPVAEADIKRLIQAYRSRQMRTLQQILAKYGVTPRHIDHKLVRAVHALAGLDVQGAGAAFGTLSSLSDFGPQFAFSVPPAGTCTLTREMQAPRFEAESRSLDAGAALSFNGPSGPRAMQRKSSAYEVSLGGGFPEAIVPSGSYSVAGSGGTGVGPFTATLNISDTLTWTNKSSISSIDRRQPVTVTWTGGPSPGFVLIGALVLDANSNSGVLKPNDLDAAVVCVEDSRKGSFTVPSFALSALPTADAGSGYLIVMPHPFSNPVQIPGLDLAYFMNGSADYKPMEFR
ncbi:MAG: hypothetical protein LAP38_06175 [Acidobacteriia bacterium]|nr:hypothetical protein [Terriglobia bacterium]